MIDPYEHEVLFLPFDSSSFSVDLGFFSILVELEIGPINKRICLFKRVKKFIGGFAILFRAISLIVDSKDHQISWKMRT